MKQFYFVIALLFCVGLTNSQTYCTSFSNNSNSGWISNVTLNTINNTSTGEAYFDYTNITTNLFEGSTYTITFTPAWSGNAKSNGYGVWIDYNKDDVFQVEEQVLTLGPNKNTPISGTFTVPSGVTYGLTRMRVSMRFNGTPGACDSGFSSGDVEDYGIILQETLSTIENELNDLVIYNTTSPKVLYVKGQLTDSATLYLYDIHGRTVLTEQLKSNANTQQIDMSNIGIGVYIAKIDYHNKSLSKKIIIQ